tara:strand:+ start:428 stop:1006 length:579 start_codon:yes stop_codon:yes gene_type:complete
MRNVIFATFLLSSCSLANAHDLIVADDIDTGFIETQLSLAIESTKVEDNLLTSGLVKQSYEVNDIQWVENSIQIDFDLYSKGQHAEYTERMLYSVAIRPYIDYTTDSVGLYPNSSGHLQSVFNNPFTRKDMNERVMVDVKRVIHDALTKSYLSESDMSNEIKSQISQYLGHLEFHSHEAEDGYTVSIIISSD